MCASIGSRAPPWLLGLPRDPVVPEPRRQLQVSVGRDPEPVARSSAHRVLGQAKRGLGPDAGALVIIVGQLNAVDREAQGLLLGHVCETRTALSTMHFEESEQQLIGG